MNKTLKTLLIILLIIIAIIIIVMALYGFVFKTHKPAFLYNLVKGDNSDYVLVYVLNGSNAVSYYGQIVSDEEDVLILKNPGYIEVSQSDTEEDAQPTVILRLMEDDFYKPTSELTIYKQNVIFVQTLSEDSPVVSAYKQIN